MTEVEPDLLDPVSRGFVGLRETRIYHRMPGIQAEYEKYLEKTFEESVKIWRN